MLFSCVTVAVHCSSPYKSYEMCVILQHIHIGLTSEGNAASSWEVAGFGVNYNKEKCTSCADDSADLWADPFASDVIDNLIFPRVVMQKSKRRKLDNKSCPVSGLSGKFNEDSLGSNLLGPSVLFATFANTYGEMLCLDLNKDFTQAVGGFRDSVVRVFTLQGTVPAPVPRSAMCILPASRSARVLNDAYRGPGQFCVFGVFSFVSSYVCISIDNFGEIGHDKIYSGKDGAPLTSGMTQVLELKGHSKCVYDVSQFNDGTEQGFSSSRLLLSASADETIRLWDVNNGNCISRYNPSAGTPWAVQFAPYGYFFASCNQNASVSVFSTDRVCPVRIMNGHVSDVTCCSWNANSILLATGSDDRTVRLWDIRVGTSIRKLSSGCAASVNSVALSPSGSSILAGCESGDNILCWDIGTGRLLSNFCTDENVFHVDYNENETKIVSGGSGCCIKIWDLNGPNPTGPMGKRKDFLGLNTSVIHPNYSFYTKRCPIYAVRYAACGVVFAGGPVLSDHHVPSRKLT